MKPETMENLGFTKENTWETEEQRKKELFDKLKVISEEARKNVESQFKEKFQREEQERNKKKE
jgi:hypothetical protein